MNIHIITLPEIQAIWWQEICERLGIFTIRNSNQVITKCSDNDRIIAWSLFVEDFNRVINQ